MRQVGIFQSIVDILVLGNLKREGCQAMRKFILWAGILIIAVIILIFLRLLTNPRSIANDGAEIREQFLTETPIGIHIDDLRLFIEQHSHWEIRSEGDGTVSGAIPGRFRNSGYGEIPIDVKTYNIHVRMESQRAGLTSREVSYAIWRFDGDGQLVDILTHVSVYRYYGWF